MAAGARPTLIGLPTLLVAVSMVMIEAEVGEVTYAVFPFGATAMQQGCAAGMTMGARAVLVAVLIGVARMPLGVE